MFKYKDGYNYYNNSFINSPPVTINQNEVDSKHFKRKFSENTTFFSRERGEKTILSIVVSLTVWLLTVNMRVSGYWKGINNICSNQSLSKSCEGDPSLARSADCRPRGGRLLLTHQGLLIQVMCIVVSVDCILPQAGNYKGQDQPPAWQQARGRVLFEVLKSQMVGLT